MYLKKLEMRGFKSFADATELEFGSGITAIVGPNGVGKSNVSDGILWVLGEQSYKTLRTASSQDIIFAGSDARRPLSMAEVSLTFDNSDGRLPTDFTEVSISRRLFRTGESQYLINKSVCRLRDVRDLLLGTGVGPDAYSVIGQGEIDTILSIRSEDRRELIEEVAGIRKYRIRRNEATRKLERTEANLTRISDIVYELTNQRKPLEREATIAREYKELDARLRQLELQILSRDFQKLNTTRAQALNDAAIAKADIASYRGRISEIDVEHGRQQRLLDEKDGQIDKLRLIIAHTRQKSAEVRQQRAVNQERLRAVEARLASVDGDIAAQKERIEQLGGQVTELQATRTSLAEQLQAAVEAAREQEEFCQQAEQSDREREAAIEQLVEKRNAAMQKIAALENEAAAMEALQADLEERSERLQSQETALTERLDSLKLNVDAANAERKQLIAQVETATAARGRYEAALARSTALLREHRAKREQLTAAIGRLEERQRVLVELQQAYEGYPEGLRTVVAAGRDGQLSGIRGVVGDLLDVPRKLEVAIQAGLGDSLGWILTNSQHEAVAAVNFLKSCEAGYAVFFPMNVSLPQSTGPRLSGASGKCLGVANQLVRYPREFAHVFEVLLGDLIVCEDIGAAIEMLQRFAGRYRAVTLAGEVIERNGAIRTGPADTVGAQSFGRKRELEAIESQLVVLRDCLAEMWQKEEQLDADVQRLRSQQQDSEEQLAEFRTAAAAAEKELSHLASTRQAAENALEENQIDIDRLEEQVDRAAERYKQVVAQCSAKREEARVAKDDIDKIRAAIAPDASVEQLRAALTERQVKVASMRERNNSTLEVFQRVRNDLERATVEHKRTIGEKAKLSEEQERLQTANATEDDGTKQLEQQLSEYEAQMKSLSETAATLREQVSTLELTMRKLQDSVMQQSERLHQAEIAITREEGRLQSTIERLADTYDMTPEEALELQDENIDEVKARRDVRHLRAEIRQLGHVNVSAIDEYERLKAREEFLASQENDLRQARDDMLAVIAEIDEAAETAFLEIFAKVQEAFLQMFHKLFDGGSAELKLTDEEHPLQAGVEIFVQVPGKKVQNLMMLSGGERAKVAIALLFAMLKVNPSPFCLLDEIDAPLDDANTERFGDILQEFTKTTQFLIITHNPHTMERVDRLHGITMAEPGASKVISVKLEDAQDMVKQDKRKVDTRSAT